MQTSANVFRRDQQDRQRDTGVKRAPSACTGCMAGCPCAAGSSGRRATFAPLASSAPASLCLRWPRPTAHTGWYAKLAATARAWVASRAWSSSRTCSRAWRHASVMPGALGDAMPCQAGPAREEPAHATSSHARSAHTASAVMQPRDGFRSPSKGVYHKGRAAHASISCINYSCSYD